MGHSPGYSGGGSLDPSGTPYDDEDTTNANEDSDRKSSYYSPPSFFDQIAETLALLPFWLPIFLCIVACCALAGGIIGLWDLRFIYDFFTSNR